MTVEKLKEQFLQELKEDSDKQKANLEAVRKRIEARRKRFNEIVSNDPKWKEIHEKFQKEYPEYK